MEEGRRIVLGIVLTCAATVALELGLVGLIGLPAGPTGPAAALAASSPATVDCDNDIGTEVNGDPSEVKECLPVGPPAKDITKDDKFELKAYMGFELIGTMLLVQGAPFAYSPLLVTLEGLLATGALVLTPELVVAAVVVPAVLSLTAGFLIADPADSNQAIALPQPLVGAPRLGQARCRLRRRNAACVRVASAMREYLRSVQAALPSLVALAVSTNRFAAAKREGLANVEVAQNAAVKVYIEEALASVRSGHRAGLALARALAQARADVPLMKRQFRQELKALAEFRGIPARMLRALEDRFAVSPTQLRAAINRAVGALLERDIPRSLRVALTRKLPATPSLTVMADSLSVEQVGYLIDDMTSNGEIRKATGAELATQLLLADRACTAGERTGPMNQFLGIVRSKLHGPVRAFLGDAATPLFGNHPYPGNLPPTAAFRASPSSQRIGSSGQAHVAFFDQSSDKADGGYIGCHEWSFGDGATSTDANPTHNYTAPGSYMVTLTAIDDDGFARTTATETVTITR